MRAFSVFICAVAALLAITANAARVVNDKPIIGILAHPTYSALTDLKLGDQYVNAAYVKWLESAGARVVPVPHKSSPEALKLYFNSLNGMVFPGGIADMDGTPYSNAGYFFLTEAIKSTDNGDPFPIWGTCHGFQMLNVLINNRSVGNTLSAFDSHHISLPIRFTPEAENSKTFALLNPSERKAALEYLSENPVTDNMHNWGVAPEVYEKSAALRNFYNVLGYSDDRKGKPFVTLIEAKKYPFFGAQFHAERPLFEWNDTEGLVQTYENIRWMSYFSAMFVEQARQSSHKFPNATAEARLLIYNTPPVYVASLIPREDKQYYFFDSKRPPI